jgi:hypothetical protein
VFLYLCTQMRFIWSQIFIHLAFVRGYSHTSVPIFNPSPLWFTITLHSFAVEICCHLLDRNDSSYSIIKIFVYLCFFMLPPNFPFNFIISQWASYWCGALHRPASWSTGAFFLCSIATSIMFH